MSALITVSNSEGVVGQCDAKCYDAQLPECDCICGGLNHGAGLEAAKDNTTKAFLGDEALEKFAELAHLERSELSLSAQGDLFPFVNDKTTAELKADRRRSRA